MSWPRRTIGIVKSEIPVRCWAAILEFLLDFPLFLKKQTVSEQRYLVKTLQRMAGDGSVCKNLKEKIRKLIEKQQ